MSSENKKMQSFIKIMTRRQLSYGLNTFTFVVMVAAILVLVNAIFSLVPLRKDLTSEGLYTISSETVNILKLVNKKINIYALYDQEKNDNLTNSKIVKEFLNQYAENEFIDLKYIDPDKSPSIIKEIDPEGVKQLTKGDIIFKSGSKVRKISFDELYSVSYSPYGERNDMTSRVETAFTGAINYMISDKSDHVYFLTGHEEMNIETNLTIFKSFLEKNNFDVKNINLLKEAKIPDDCVFLVSAAPKSDITNIEKTKIKDYLRTGGNAVFLLDALESDTKFPLLEEVISEYGLGLNYDIIKENNSNMHLPGNQFEILISLEPNSINSNFDVSTFQMVIPNARSISINKGKEENPSILSLVKSGPQSVGIAIDKTKNSDIKGPLSISALSELRSSNSISKVLLIGNATFVEDLYIQKTSNGLAFLLNAMGQMREFNQGLFIAPKNMDSQVLHINEMEARVIAVILILIIPVIILIIGMSIWLRRRNL